MIDDISDVDHSCFGAKISSYRYDQKYSKLGNRITVLDLATFGHLVDAKLTILSVTSWNFKPPLVHGIYKSDHSQVMNKSQTILPQQCTVHKSGYFFHWPTTLLPLIKYKAKNLTGRFV